MTTSEMGTTIFALGVLLASTQLIGYLFEQLRQPRFVGEILTGILLGPFVLGQLAPSFSSAIFGAPSDANTISSVLGFIYWFGLLLLMFISGTHVRRVLGQENRRQTLWLLGVGTPIPFFLVLAAGLLALLPMDSLTGPAGQKTSTLLILSIAVAITSIPVISRIFYDLKILHTRFASLILGFAMIEDIILWAVLAIATALAKTAVAQQNLVSDIATHVSITVAYMTLGLLVAPRLLKKFHVSRWNALHKSSEMAYVVSVLFAYIAVATLLEVNLIFAAFLAGFGVVGGMEGQERARFSKVLDAIEHFSASVFVPIYFTLVGYKLVFGKAFSMPMLFYFLAGSTLLTLLARGLAAKFAKFNGLDMLNIAITSNARGGPGIVLASVAYDAGIISASFYTTLVLTAVLTSQAAGVWLRYVLTKGWPLLSNHPEETWSIDPATGQLSRATTPATAATT
jgi:Kef-type K+ transport system membrane component KefB